MYLLHLFVLLKLLSLNYLVVFRCTCLVKLARNTVISKVVKNENFQ